MAKKPVQIALYAVKHRCHARWRRTTKRRHTVRGEEIKYGRLLDDGRWYVDVIADEGDRCYPVPDQETALRQVESWMRRLEGEWEQVECYPHDGWQDGEREEATPPAGPARRPAPPRSPGQR